MGRWITRESLWGDRSMGRGRDRGKCGVALTEDGDLTEGEKVKIEVVKEMKGGNSQLWRIAV